MLATMLGTLVGIGRLSRNFLVRALCTAYVEMFRNVPLLLQLFIWYFVLTELLPPIDEALQPLPGCLLQQERPAVSDPGVGTGHRLTLAARRSACVGAWLYVAGRARSSRRPGTPRRVPAGAGDHRRLRRCSAGSPAARRPRSTSREDRDHRGRRRRGDAGVPGACCWG